MICKRFLGLSIFCFLYLFSLNSLAYIPDLYKNEEGLPTLAPMLKKVNPAVVNISTLTTKKVNNPMFDDPFFRHFFGGPNNRQFPSQERKTQSAGSGVIIDAEEGIVITNFHVVDNADEINVKLYDQRSYEATMIGGDPEVDIAILKIDAEDLVQINLANSDQIQQGDFVVAIGNPFGLENTVTTGVISAIGRSDLGIEGYENFIQTDASINPGNSGGALVNLKGELIGINTAIIAPSGGNVGIGLAIPINMAKNSADQLIEYGEVKRGQLGVQIQSLTKELAEAFGLDSQQKGVLISKVTEGSSAESAGLLADDIIVAVNGKTIDSTSKLRNFVGGARIGEVLQIKIIRESKELIISVPVGKKMDAYNKASDIHPSLEGAKLKNSVNEKGVDVVSISNGSPASQSGLRPNDRIVSINRVVIENLEQLTEVARQSKGALLVRVIRGNGALYIILN
jgi:serine protease DegQ